MSLPLSYTVELQEVNNPSAVRTFAGVTGDGILQDAHQNSIPYRFMILQDQSRIEFPMSRYIVRFSPERALVAEAARQRVEAQQRTTGSANDAKMN
jgi:hypothetical protein